MQLRLDRRDQPPFILEADLDPAGLRASADLEATDSASRFLMTSTANQSGKLLRLVDESNHGWTVTRWRTVRRGESNTRLQVTFSSDL